MPIFFGLILIPVVAVMGVMSYRMIRGIKNKVDSGQAEWTDDWDPFQ